MVNFELSHKQIKLVSTNCAVATARQRERFVVTSMKVVCRVRSALVTPHYRAAMPDALSRPHQLCRPYAPFTPTLTGR